MPNPTKMAVILLFLSISGFFTTKQTLADVGAQQAFVNPSATLSVYLMGMGSSYVIEWLIDSIGDTKFASDTPKQRLTKKSMKKSL